MSDLEKTKNPDASSDGFFGKLSQMLKDFKNKLSPEKNTNLYEENNQSKDKLSQLKADVLTTKEQRESKSELLLQKNAELLSLKNTVISNKKVSSKNIGPIYQSKHPETLDWLKINQDQRIAAPWIAENADILRDEIKDVPLLKYFYA